jgi:hypothetical protein
VKDNILCISLLISNTSRSTGRVVPLFFQELGRFKLSYESVWLSTKEELFGGAEANANIGSKISIRSQMLRAKPTRFLTCQSTHDLLVVGKSFLAQQHLLRRKTRSSPPCLIHRDLGLPTLLSTCQLEAFDICLDL